MGARKKAPMLPFFYRTIPGVRLCWVLEETKGTKDLRCGSRLREGRSVCLCWAPSKPKGPKGSGRPLHVFGLTFEVSVVGADIKRLFSDRFYSIGKQPVYFPMSFACVFLLFLYRRTPRFRATSRTNALTNGKPATESQSFP